MPEGKRELREAVRKARQKLAPAYRQKASAAMLAKLFELEIYRQASSVMAYCPMAEEVQLTPLLKHSLSQGKTVALPYVISKGLMAAVKLHDMDSLVEGAYGILTVGEEKREFLSPGLLDLVVVPGVAFGLDGSRLGMGAGFYDRFLSEREPRARRVALCFDCQLVPEIPVEMHDQRVEAIITETRFINCH